MNRFPLLVVPALAMALAACEASEAPVDQPTAEAEQPALLGGTTINLADGGDAGSAELNAAGDKVTISITLANLPEGTHAVHLHTTGTCEGPDFTSAGPHLNPGMKEHGTENPAGAHLGDLPNAVIGADGSGSISATLRGTREEVLSAIFDEDGTAVVVHEGEDDYVTDPSGDAGGRIACGVLSQTTGQTPS